MNIVIRSILFVSISSLAISTSVRSDQSEGAATYEESVAAQVSEGLSLAAGAKAAVTEHYFDRGQFPRSNEEAGLAPPHEIKGKYVAAVTVGPTPGVIVIEFRGSADPAIAGRTIVHKPSPANPKPTWTCSSTYISDNYLPESCKEG